MTTNNKMCNCRVCNAPIAKSAKRCPSCGAKNKKPFYKRAWFIILTVVVVIAAISKVNSKDSENNLDNNLPVTSTPTYSQNTTASSESNNDTVSSVHTTSPTEATTATTTSSNDTTPVSGLRPEFKAAMDAYETFYDEYCDFMKKYQADPTNITLITEYYGILQKLNDMNEAFESWESEDLNHEEMAYYLDVNQRISKKLLEIAQ